MLLCYLLHTFCLPILLYGLEAVTMSNVNLRTLYVAWKTALYKIFKLNNDANLLHTQYCCGVLPINFVLDVRKLCFLSKQRCHSISVHNVFYDILVSLNLTGYVQCILCVDSLVDILLHQFGTFS